MYFHAATRRCPEIDRHTPDYEHEAEFQALTSSRVRETLEGQETLAVCFREI